MNVTSAIPDLPPDEVRRMLLTCPGADGAAPMIRTSDALESTIQKVTDLGAIGVIGPTRMPYEKVVTIVDYTSSLVTRVLTT